MRGVVEDFGAVTLTPLFLMGRELINSVPDLLAIVLIVLGARYLLKLGRSVFSATKQGKLTISGFDPEWPDSTYNIVRVLIIALTVVVCYPYIPGSGLTTHTSLCPAQEASPRDLLSIA